MSRPNSLAGLTHQAMPAFVLRAGRVDHKPISSAFSCFVGVAKRHEKLFRNVPFLTSLEVSPFPVLLLSGSLALPGAQPCGARRAERLGRSAGQRPATGAAGQPLVWTLSAVPATGRLPPRVIRRRHPLPLCLRPTCCV